MHPYFFPGLEVGPSVVARLSAKFLNPEIDISYSSGRFTVREVVAHLADWETIFRSRMELAVVQTNPMIVILDEDERAIEQGYAQLNLAEQIHKFQGQRDFTIEFLKGLAPGELRRAYIHPEFGEMLVEDQANMLLGHDLYHIDQLLTYLDMAQELRQP